MGIVLSAARSGGLHKKHSVDDSFALEQKSVCLMAIFYPQGGLVPR
jgi:hypothetical protein